MQKCKNLLLYKSYVIVMVHYSIWSNEFYAAHIISIKFLNISEIYSDISWQKRPIVNLKNITKH